MNTIVRSATTRHVSGMLVVSTVAVIAIACAAIHGSGAAVAPHQPAAAQMHGDFPRSGAVDDATAVRMGDDRWWEVSQAPAHA